MKKVELITLHRIVNYGSVLQAYATQQVLKKLNYNVEFIDYYPPRMHLIGMLKRIRNKNIKFEKNFFLRNIARIIIFPSYIIRFKTFKKFVKQNLITSSKIYYSYDQLASDYPKADIYCTGSDQVWNSGWNEKVDKTFFLGFLNSNEKRIAYAASFGKKELDESEKKATKELLKKYLCISTREKSGIKILEDLNILNAINVLDPTLLLNGKDWSQIASTKFDGKKYIFVYNLNRNKKIDIYAKNLSKATGLKIKYISYQLHEFYKHGRMYCNSSIELFLSLIKNATYVITDSFHATAFSLNFNKEFIIVYPEKYSTRLQSILELTGLENRVAKNEQDLKIVDSKIDYEKVNTILNKERKKSVNWLSNALEKCQD